jgi:hypothetical protein
MRITLHKLEATGDRRLVGDFVTNADGRTGPALKGEAFEVTRTLAAALGNDHATT